MTAASSYEFVEGATSDLSFVARGETLGEVFRAAAEALLAVTVEQPVAVATRVSRPVVLAEPDLELLLLRFLNELVYLRDAEQLLLHPGSLRIATGADARLTGELCGEPIDPSRHSLLTEVKAATAHGLSVSRSAEGWEATVTLDV